MSCYFIVSVKIGERDRTRYDEYIERVKPLVEGFGGEYLVRTEHLQALTPGWKPDRLIIIRFESREKLDACFSSEEYQAIKDLRITSVDADVVIAEGL